MLNPRKLLLLTSFFLMICVSASADYENSTSDPSNGMNSPAVGGRRRGGGKRNPIGKSSRNPGTIQGVCTVVQSLSNPFEGPCVNTLLVLKDREGNEISKSRTSSRGDFEFAAEHGTSYLLTSGSRYYQVVEPASLIEGGNKKVALKLKQQD